MLIINNFNFHIQIQVLRTKTELFFYNEALSSFQVALGSWAELGSLCCT